VRHSEVLKDLSLRLAPATTTALVGATGAGKTTVALLVAGVYAPTTGRVLLDGCDVTRLRTEDRLRAIGVVTQDAHLVHASIRTNLLLACPDASPASLVEAVAAAGLEEFIHSLPDGYDTIVGVNGVRLSGGQRQRLSLARVLLQSPRVVVLDEATAHLDVETETLVRARLRERLRGRTTLVVAHRLSTVLDADQVAVLKEGRLCELGHPGELLRRGGAFSRLCTAAGLDVTAAQPPEQQGNSTLGIRAQDISAASDDQSVAGSAPGHAT
jgi:ATP-binding cassette subfamily B protein